MKNYGIEISGPITITTDNTHDLGSGTYKLATAYATTFNGTATTSTYADLAERYTCKDSKLPEGMVMEISDGEFDVELAKFNSQHVIGVISKKPAYLMDQWLGSKVTKTRLEVLQDGTKRTVPCEWSWDSVIVGLKGKIPVRVIGPVHKRDLLVPAGAGLATAFKRSITKNESHFFSIGIALETNLDEGEKLVKTFLKIERI